MLYCKRMRIFIVEKQTKTNNMIITKTNTATITESELKDNIIIEFNDDNENNSCIISFSKRLQKFVLEFNSELIHSSKTFKSLILKLNELVEKHELNKMIVEEF